MRKVVVDASVCLKWVFEEKDSEKARNLLTLSEKGDILLLAPEIWEYEIVNGFASAMLKNKLSYVQSRKLLRMVLKASPQTIATHDLLLKSLKNCHKYKISAYDSAYVTLAAENRIILISADEKLVQKVNDPNAATTLDLFS
ncbi:MAG: type II toxin-antitoxin system VapC family toxin [Candidatus Levybacteria bacterium]|nr:type II toxin-antitoxin system VapC family toxin [Candidatus Levybacteria bacterium]